MEIAPGLWTPRVSNIERLTTLPDPYAEIRLNLAISLNELMRYRVDSFAVKGEGGTEVNGALLRRIPLAAYVQLGAAALPSVQVREGLWVPFSRAGNPNLETAKLLEDSDPLVNVARHYAYQEAIGGTPAASVSKALGIPRSTADSWIRRAKDKGYIYADA